jgi:hypothetical protein
MWRFSLLKWILASCLIAAISIAPRAVVAQTTNDAGLWTAVLASGDLNLHAEDSKWRWWFDGQMRFFDDNDGFGQSLVRPGVGYKLMDKLTVWSGYAWIHTNPDPSPNFEEHRIWQQVTWTHKFDPTTLDLRSRFEQRFVETGDDTGLRFRQSVALRRPVGFAPQFTWVATDEFFFHLNDTDWGARAGFDQNRAFLGVGWRPSPEHTWRVEVGYLNQFIDRNAPTDVSNHLLSVNLYWNP